MKKKRRLPRKRYKALPPHTWESHSTKEAGEINKPFLIAIIVVVAILALSLFMYFQGALIGKAFQTGQEGIGIEDSVHDFGPAFSVPIKANIGSGKQTVAFGFEITLPIGLNCNNIILKDKTNWDIHDLLVDENSCINGVMRFRQGNINPKKSLPIIPGTDFVVADLEFAANIPVGTYTITLENVEIIDFSASETGHIDLGIKGESGDVVIRIPPGETECTDLIDNDNDGHTDCSDTDCANQACTGGFSCPSSGFCGMNCGPDGNSCDDSNVCTSGDVCSNDQCGGTDNILTCPLPNGNTGQCVSGSCQEPSCGVEGSSCDDGNSCTTGSICNANDQCSDGTSLPDDTECITTNNVAGTCSSGTCQPYSCGLDGASCDDGNSCTGTDICQNDQCIGINDNSLICRLPNQDAGQCSGGLCKPIENTQCAFEGEVCDDGSQCTTFDRCNADLVCVGDHLDDGSQCTKNNGGAGSCQIGICTCLENENLCSSQCVDKQNDINNCGSCGNKCSNGKICQAGACVNQCTDKADCLSGEVCENNQCVLAKCGNGVVDVGEICDGSVAIGSLSGNTCTDVGSSNGNNYVSGDLACNSQCTFDVNDCNQCDTHNDCDSGEACVNNECRPVEPADTPSVVGGGLSGGTCNPSWGCKAWTYCTKDLNQTRVCEDINRCKDPKPEVQECSPCDESWVCSEFSGCGNGIKSRTCVDEHACGTVVNKPTLTDTCPVSKINPPAFRPPVVPQESFWQKNKTPILAGSGGLLLLLTALGAFLWYRNAHMVAYNFGELTTWISKELAMGTSKKDVLSILKDKTGWTHKEITKAFDILEGNNVKSI